MRKLLVIVLVGIVLVTLGTGITLATTSKPASISYAIPWDVISGGGNEMASTNFAIQGTIGQGAIGPGSSDNFTIGTGYWYGWKEHLFKVILPTILKNYVP